MGTFGGNRNVFFAQIFTHISALCGHDPRRNKRGRCGRRSADGQGSARAAGRPGGRPSPTVAKSTPASWGNPDSPGSGLNTGRLFDDRANEPTLNAALFTVTRATGSAGYDVGFTIQGEFGTDARFTHYMGVDPYWINSRYPVFPVAGQRLGPHALALPRVVSTGKSVCGRRLKARKSSIPAGNLFYSHSYIFNYPEPFNDFGVLAITHINPTLDIYTAVSSGQQTTLVAYER